MKIQSVITGYLGGACTVLAVYDESGGGLYVAKAVGYREARVDDSAIVSNVELQDLESMFTEDHFADAIDAYMMMKHSGLIEFGQSAFKCNPDSAIELDGITESGKKMRVSPDIKSEQVAVLAMCWYCKKARTTAKVMGMMDSLLRISSGEILTI